MPKLLWLFVVPLLAALLAFLLPIFAGKRGKYLAVVLSLFPLVLLLAFGYTHWIGESVQVTWFAPLAIQFHLEVDSLSLLFVTLTSLIIPISLLAVREEQISYPSLFYGFVFLLQGLLIGFFTSRDLALFTIFWEAMLFPLYFIILLWGGEHRQRAALKFLMYMIAGSALMVAAVLALYLNGSGSFNFTVLSEIAENVPYARWIFAVFLLAFAVKTPLFPFHAWLPEAYDEAPTSGTILLSSLLSKAGIYGLLRIGLGFFPNLIQEWSPLLLGLAITGVLYGGLAAWMQTNYKRLIAYSSFSHVNFILVGIFIGNVLAHEGAILQALNHGVTIAGLFLVAGWLQERLGTKAMSAFSGVAQFLPQLCWLTLVFVLSSVALPGTNNFVGELLILFALFKVHPVWTAVLGLTVILSVIYMLRWMQKVYFEKPGSTPLLGADIRSKELAIALPLIALIFWVGIYPAPLLRQIESPVKKTSVVEEEQ